MTLLYNISNDKFTKYGLMLNFMISGVITFAVAMYFQDVWYLTIPLIVASITTCFGGIILTLEYYRIKIT